ncbi:hypothetical protein HMPREF0281_01478 [Corynebacterium ammoniagenes DSM 20306]|uniref:Uncharacterized protein n=1 Tax=Corynebacterium ammoniagenes DSM 20306 TaxID=649754 RepID=A0ABP2IFR8_CORAM|nr:hypothetical protein HMPREF0281_01478 [Corynebacterium ammoniagenes DSM 20306]
MGANCAEISGNEVKVFKVRGIVQRIVWRYVDNVRRVGAATG